MGIPGSANPLLFGGAAVYEIEQSLRFNSADSAYLNRTPASAGNRKTYTLSAWVKICVFGNSVRIFEAGTSNSTDRTLLYFSSDKFQFFTETGNVVKGNLSTNAVFRDPSAWYHVVWAVDTANTSVKIYVNGVEQTLTTTTAVANENTYVNATNVHYISQSLASAGYLDGYLAEVNFIDGSALAPTDFGEFDNNGVWRPIQYAGSYTGNSFYLKFASGDGTDSSGLSNTWTANNFTTSGNYTDVVGDTPTTNYSTLNPTLPSLWAQNISEGNTRIRTTSSNGGYAAVLSQSVNPANSFYFEIEAYTNGAASPTGGTPMAVVFVDADQPAKYSTQTSTWTFSNAHYTKRLDFLGMLWFHFYKSSATGSQQYFYENGTGTGAGTALTATSGSCETSGGYSGGSPNYSGVPRTGIYYNASTQEMTLFGADNNGSNAQSAVYDISNWNTDFVKNWAIVFQGQFQSGFLGGGYIRYFASPDQWVISGRPDVPGIAATNLPAPDIADGSDYFNTVLYTGDNSEQSITGVGFQPDFAWIRRRNGIAGHCLQDAVRGVQKFLTANSTETEYTSSGTIISFDSDGFTLGAGNPLIETNNTGGNFVAWNWLASNTSGSSNTAGTITSTVSANPTAGFSIVSYTGNGIAGASVGHSLGVDPAMIITKARDLGSSNWKVYHASVGATKYLNLNDTTAATSGGAWGNTAPTSSVFYVGDTYDNVNNGYNFIAYCFAEVEGYSKFGSYIGNGSTDGVFVYLGFKPALLLTKQTNTTGDWIIQDSARGEYNPDLGWLYPNLAAAEETGTSRYCDFLSNGFKIRNGGTGMNTSGGTYIFIAFAENPFGGSGVSPATAR